MEAHSFARSDGGLATPRSRKLLSAFGDERLIAQLRRGNEAAFEVLYDRHHAGVLSYCRHMLGSRDEAEDALQQAFVSAHADIVSSDKPIRFKAWIYTIARNRCLSLLRARREQPSADIDRVSTAGLSDEVQHRADLRELLADMQELPDDQRDALILSELGALSHAEVAKVIGCEAAKVKSLVFQARSGLLERREARETPCHEIREQLSTLRGGSLRRGPLRRHLKACPGCTEFREDVRRQRQAFAAVLPVVPTLALKENALAAVGITAGSASVGAAGAGAGAVFVAKTGVAKVAVIAVATTGTVGGAVAVEKTVIDDGSKGGPATQAGDSRAAGAGAAGAAATHAEGAAALAGVDGGVPASEKARDEALIPGKNGTAGEQSQGFEPVQGESNGERARDFAAGQGEGNHTGLNKLEGRVENPGGRDNANAGQKPKKNTPQRSETPGAQGNSRATPTKPDATTKPKPEKPLTELLPPVLKPETPRSEPQKGTQGPQNGTRGPQNESPDPLP